MTFPGEKTASCVIPRRHRAWTYVITTSLNCSPTTSVIRQPGTSTSRHPDKKQMAASGAGTPSGSWAASLSPLCTGLGIYRTATPPPHTHTLLKNTPPAQQSAGRGVHCMREGMLCNSFQQGEQGHCNPPKETRC